MFQLPGVGRRRWQMLHLGLEDHEAVQEVEGARRRVHHLAVAPTRAQQAAHRWLGRTHQILGLNKITLSMIPRFNFQPNMNHEP